MSTEPALWNETVAEVVPATVDAERGGEVVELVELAERARDYARNAKGGQHAAGV